MPADDMRLEMTDQAKRIVLKLKMANAMPILRRQLREATDPIVPALRAEVKATPSQNRVKSEKGGSLRGAVAAAMKRQIQLTTRTVRVAIVNKPHGGKSNLARVLEGEIPWKHPTYGHKPEVIQQSHPYFFRTVEKFGPEIDLRVRAVLNKIEREL